MLFCYKDCKQAKFSANMFRNVAEAILIFTLSASIASSGNYNPNELKKRFPDYGTTWIYMPDENEVPTVAYLELPPADEVILFPSFEEIRDALSFTLYARNLRSGQTFTFHNLTDFGTSFNSTKDTKCVIHGWLSSAKSDMPISIKNAYLDKEDVNVVLVDWSRISSNLLYLIPMANTKEVGVFYAQFLNHIIDLGVSPRQIHLIGHSLGAHVSGFAGRFVFKGKVRRITGLDPALPGFSKGFWVDHLLPSDGEFVDVIHTCGGVLGFLTNLGHVDFFPNGGIPPQNGCDGLQEIIEACSHGRSWKYFSESINGGVQFLANKCNSWSDFLGGSCKGEVVAMGEPVPSTARGSYYLKTRSSAPFAIANNISDVADNYL